jgi:nitroreductase
MTLRGATVDGDGLSFTTAGLTVAEPPTIGCTSETIELLHGRSSTRAFAERAVDDRLLDAVLAAAVRAPTSFNFQAYALVVVRDPVRREKLAALAGQRHVAAAPVVVVICADIARLSGLGEAYQERVRPHDQDLLMIATIDASLAGMCLALSAESLGLGSAMCGGVRNRPDDLAELLELPPDVTPLFGICLGWPERKTPPRPRIRPELLTHRERYQGNQARHALNVDQSTLGKRGDPVSAADVAAWQKQIERGLRFAQREVNVSH